MSLDPDVVFIRGDAHAEFAQLFFHGCDPVALFDAQPAGMRDVCRAFCHGRKHEQDRTEVGTVIQVDRRGLQRTAMNEEAVIQRLQGSAEIVEDRQDLAVSLRA